MALSKNNDRAWESGRDKGAVHGADQKGVQETDERRLKAEIERMEKELLMCYGDVGREYYDSAHGNPMSENMSDSFRKIEDLNKKIRDCENKIRIIRGITVCEKCGADVLVTDSFCCKCGARIISEVTISPAGGSCPNCGHPVAPGMLFCSTCGAKMNISSEFDEDMDAAGESDREVSTVERYDFGDALEKEALGEVFDRNMSVPEAKRGYPDFGDTSVDIDDLWDEEPQIYTGGGNDRSSAAASDPVRPAFCLHCGAPLEPDDMFCINCGQKVEV